MKALYTLFLLALSTQLHAQTYDWTNTFGGSDNGDLGYSVATDATGNVYIAGTCYNTSVDLDPGPGTTLLSTPLGHLLIGFIAKYDPSGNLIWARNTGQNLLYSMCLDVNGNIFATGVFEDSTEVDPTSGTNYLYSNGGRDIFLCKYDASGNFVWAHGFGETDQDYGLKVSADIFGNAYITGYFSNTIDFDPSASVSNETSNGGWDCFLAKYDPTGNYSWSLNLGSTNDDVGRAICADNSGNVYFTGLFRGTTDFDPGPAVNTLTAAGGADIFIASYDNNGNYLWAKKIGNTSSGEEASSICFMSGSLFVTGSFTGTVDFDPGTGSTNLISAGSTDIFYSKFDTAGNLIFAHAVGGSSEDRAYEIRVDSSENIYLTGAFRGTADFDPGGGTSSATAPGITYNAFLSKHDQSGNFIWMNSVGNTDEDMGRSIAISPTKDIYHIGWFMGTVDFNPDGTADNKTSNGNRDVFLTKYENPITDIASYKDHQENLFKLYPNPANSALFCETTDNTQLYIYNASGSLIHNQQLSAGKHTLDISHYPSGLYLVRSSFSSTGTTLVKQ